MIQVHLYRYLPDQDTHPHMDRVDLPDQFHSRMVLDALEYLHEQDPTLPTDALVERACAALTV